MIILNMQMVMLYFPALSIYILLRQKKKHLFSEAAILYFTKGSRFESGC